MEIKTDSQNARVHDQRNRDAIKKSLQDLGAGRSVLVDADNIVIAGNGVYEQAQELGIPVKVIESDGRELIAIRRTDLKSSDRKRKALAIADNKTTDLSIFDEEKLAEIIADLDTFTSTIGFSDEELEKLLGQLKPADYSQHNQEIDPNELEEELDCQCPRCGFRFSSTASVPVPVEN